LQFFSKVCQAISSIISAVRVLRKISENITDDFVIYYYKLHTILVLCNHLLVDDCNPGNEGLNRIMNT